MQIEPVISVTRSLLFLAACLTPVVYFTATVCHKDQRKKYHYIVPCFLMCCYLAMPDAFTIIDDGSPLNLFWFLFAMVMATFLLKFIRPHALYVTALVLVGMPMVISGSLLIAFVGNALAGLL